MKYRNFNATSRISHASGLCLIHTVLFVLIIVLLFGRILTLAPPPGKVLPSTLEVQLLKTFIFAKITKTMAATKYTSHIRTLLLYKLVKFVELGPRVHFRLLR